MKNTFYYSAAIVAALGLSTGCALGQCWGGSCYSRGFRATYYASVPTYVYGGGYQSTACESVQTVPAPRACAPAVNTPTPSACAPCSAFGGFSESFPVIDETPSACSPCASVVSSCESAPIIAQEGGAMVCACSPCACSPCSCKESDVLTVREIRPLLAAVNAARVARGLAALTLDVAMESGARAHSESMRRYGALYHANAGCAENCARAATIDDAVRMWSNSQGHARNMFNPRYTRAGVGVARDSNGRAYFTLRLR